jgi:predicted ester cyclase
MTPPPTPEPAKPKTGAELAEMYKMCIANINDAKWDAFKAECIDPGITIHDFADGSTKKADDLVGMLQSMKAGMPDFKMQPQLIMVSGRNILAATLVTGTHTAPMKSPMGEMPATNKKIGTLFFHRLAISDANKATEEWAYSDPATMMGQLGMAPKEAPPTRPAMETGWEGAPIVVVTADDAKEKTNLENAKKAIEAINARKFTDALALMTPDAVESDVTSEKDTKGAKDIEAGMKMWFGAFSDAKISVEHEYAAGDYVVHTGKFSGTNDKDLGKMKKTGKKVDLDYAEVMLIKDGKAAHVWRFHSGMMFAMQMGLMPPPGAPPAAGEEKK